MVGGKTWKSYSCCCQESLYWMYSWILLRARIRWEILHEILHESVPWEEALHTTHNDTSSVCKARDVSAAKHFPVYTVHSPVSVMIWARHVCIRFIHGSPGTEIPGIGTEIGVFGHVWRYFYRIGTGDSDFLSSGLESVSVDCDIVSTGMYILHTTYALWALSKRKQLFLMWLDHSQDKPQVSLVSLQSTNQQYRNLSSFLLNSDLLPAQPMPTWWAPHKALVTRLASR